MTVTLIEHHEQLLPRALPDWPCSVCLSDESHGSEHDFMALCARCARPLHVECGIAVSRAQWDAAELERDGEDRSPRFTFLCGGCLS